MGEDEQEEFYGFINDIRSNAYHYTMDLCIAQRGMDYKVGLDDLTGAPDDIAAYIRGETELNTVPAYVVPFLQVIAHGLVFPIGSIIGAKAEIIKKVFAGENNVFAYEHEIAKIMNFRDYSLSQMHRIFEIFGLSTFVAILLRSEGFQKATMDCYGGDEARIQGFTNNIIGYDLFSTFVAGYVVFMPVGIAIGWLFGKLVTLFSSAKLGWFGRMFAKLKNTRTWGWLSRRKGWQWAAFAFTVFTPILLNKWHNGWEEHQINAKRVNSILGGLTARPREKLGALVDKLSEPSLEATTPEEADLANHCRELLRNTNIARMQSEPGDWPAVPRDLESCKSVYSSFMKYATRYLDEELVQAWNNDFETYGSKYAKAYSRLTPEEALEHSDYDMRYYHMLVAYKNYVEGFYPLQLD